MAITLPGWAHSVVGQPFMTNEKIARASSAFAITAAVASTLQSHHRATVSLPASESMVAVRTGEGLLAGICSTVSVESVRMTDAGDGRVLS